MKNTCGFLFLIVFVFALTEPIIGQTERKFKVETRIVNWENDTICKEAKNAYEVLLVDKNPEPTNLSNIYIFNSNSSLIKGNAIIIPNPDVCILLKGVNNNYKELDVSGFIIVIEKTDNKLVLDINLLLKISNKNTVFENSVHTWNLSKK